MTAGYRLVAATQTGWERVSDVEKYFFWLGHPGLTHVAWADQ